MQVVLNEVQQTEFLLYEREFKYQWNFARGAGSGGGGERKKKKKKKKTKFDLEYGWNKYCVFPESFTSFVF